MKKLLFMYVIFVMSVSVSFGCTKKTEGVFVSKDLKIQLVLGPKNIFHLKNEWGDRTGKYEQDGNQIILKTDGSVNKVTVINDNNVETKTVKLRRISQKDKDNIEIAKTRLKAMYQALKNLNLDVNKFPTQEEGLEILWKKPTEGKWYGPYIEEGSVNDPWGNPYQYSPPKADSTFKYLVLYSFGADGHQGGEYNNKDIGYFLPKRGSAHLTPNGAQKIE